MRGEDERGKNRLNQGGERKWRDGKENGRSSGRRGVVEEREAGEERSILGHKENSDPPSNRNPVNPTLSNTT